MARIGWGLLTLLAASYVCDAYKILVIFPLPGKSHGILGDGVVRHLLNAGHEITQVTPFPSQKKIHANLTQIDVSSNLELVPKDMMTLKNIMKNNQDLDYALMLFLMNYIASTTLEHENVVKVLKDPTIKFDLVIAEWMFNELYSGLSAIYQVPLVWYSSMEPHWLILSLVDEYLNPAYNGWVLKEIPPFNFGQRVMELLSTIKITLARDTIVAYLQYRAYNRLVVPYIEQRGGVVPAFGDLKYNASLIIGNSHVSMGQSTRLPQAWKSVGGYHIDDEFKPLPEDLQKLLDESKDGVIYFSMGSNFKSKDFPDELKKDLLDVFGSLKQTVLWKFEESIADKPKNVHFLSWAPQQSILSHSNCVLFITHGGLLSTIETIHTATPIIGIPVSADQFINVGRAVSKGFAKQVTLSYTMAGELKAAINDILTDPKYKKKVDELSFIYYDRPVKPGDELVHWVEHVIKTGGAPHLRSTALMVPWYQKVYLDLAIVLLIATYVLVKAYKIVKPLVFSKKAKKE